MKKYDILHNGSYYINSKIDFGKKEQKMKFLRTILIFTLVLCMFPVTAFAMDESVSSTMGVGDHSMSERESNNSEMLADRIYDDYTVSGYVSGYDLDFFVFTLSARSEVTIVAVADYSSFTMALENSNETIIRVATEEGYNGSTYTYSMTETLSAGTYYTYILDDIARSSRNYYMFYITIEPIHTHDYDLYYDDTYHWYECDGCHSSHGMQAHYGGVATTTEYAICEFCGAPYGELAPKDGFVSENGVTRYYINGVAQTGWQIIGGVYYYFDSDGVMATGAENIGGKVYVFDESGKWKTSTGWEQIGANWYYFNKASEAQTGWQKISGTWYYFDSNGVMATGARSIDGKIYVFSDSGAWIMSGGWNKVSGAWYYLNASGEAQTGWQKINGSWYYFGSNGVMTTGWKKVDGEWYYFDADGFMVTGWRKVGASWYYMDEYGVMVTGWKKVGTYWYYFDADGVMATGWEKVDGEWYYFDANGLMVTGWLKVGTSWYYMDEYGVMTVGWLKVNGVWYYFDANGVMAADTRMLIDGQIYTFDENGAML